MPTLKKIAAFLQTFFEEWLPCAAFSIMFLVFVVQIFMRYAMKAPIAWSYEVTVFAFMWTVMFGACYASRKRRHVAFTMIYDMLPVKWKAITRMLGNLIIFATFIIAIVPTADYVAFMKVQKSPVFRITFNYMYWPFLVFLVMTVIYTGIEIVGDARVLLGKTEKASGGDAA